MVTYRYFTADLLTGAVKADLELYGVYMTNQLNKSGQFTGSFKLTDDSLVNSLATAALEPGRTALYVERNGALIWGGIIWSRLSSSVTDGYQVSAQTFHSYFDHMVFQAHVIQQKVEQAQLFKNCLDQLQAQAASNIGLAIQTPLPSTAIPRTVLLPNYEFHYGIDAISQLVGVDLGLEYTIDIVASATPDVPIKRLRLGYPKLGVANSELVFDFPGNVKNYYMPESAANSGAKFAATGAGSGNKVVRAVATDQDALDAGYPSWWIVNQYPNIADLRTITDQVAADANEFRIPYKTPTFDLRGGEEGVNFSAWHNLGDTFKVHIEDKRYPNGFDITSRMIGWELTPQSSDSEELLKLTIDGADF